MMDRSPTDKNEIKNIKSQLKHRGRMHERDLFSKPEKVVDKPHLYTRALYLIYELENKNRILIEKLNANSSDELRDLRRMLSLGIEKLTESEQPFYEAMSILKEMDLS